MIKYLSWPSRIGFLMCLSAYLLITYWLWWPYEPMVIHSIEILNKDEVYTGEYLDYQVSYTKKATHPVVLVTRQLVDGAIIILKPGQATRLPVGTHQLTARVKIPEYACSEETRFLLTAAYQVNPIRQVVVSTVSKPFEVKKRDGGLDKLKQEIMEMKGIQDGQIIREYWNRNSPTGQASGGQ